MSNDTAVQATITGNQSADQQAVFGVWLDTMCDGFTDNRNVIIYADNKEDAAVQAILGECYGYDEDEDEDDNIIDTNDVRNAVKNEERFTDSASETDISVVFIVPLTAFDMKMVLNGKEREFTAYYPIEENDFPEYVINHYYR